MAAATPFTRQAADRLGPTSPGVMGGTGEGTGGGGNRYKVVAVPQGLTSEEAYLAALAWGGRLAILDTPADVDFVFKLADDPKYWRNTPKNCEVVAGAKIGEEKAFARAAHNGEIYDVPSSIGDSHGVVYDYLTENINNVKIVSAGSIGPRVGQHPEITGSGFAGTKSRPNEENRTNEPWFAVNIGEGYAFYGTEPNSRQPNFGTSTPNTYSFVVEFVSVPLRANDVSIGQGRLGSHTYEVISTPDGINWFDAQNQARTRGGYLAIIRSVEENNFVFKLLQSCPTAWKRKSTLIPPQMQQTVNYTAGPWLGGFKADDGHSMPWIWRWFHNVTGPDETGVSQDRMTYANWDWDNHLDASVKSGKSLERHDFYGLLYVSAGHTPQPTWGAAWPEYLNDSYVVEYDDPPGSGP